MKKHDQIIAIDPDVDKSGVACLSLTKMKLDGFSMPIPILIDYLKDVKLILPNTIVIVEAGWLIKSNWHLKKFDNRHVASAKGNSAGRNHEVGRIIVQMAKHYGLEVIEQRPLKKVWSGPDGKITHDELNYFMPGIPKRTNQEVRDAILLAANYAGIPIWIKPKKRT